MRDRNCLILIAADGDGRPVGQFRVNLRSDSDGDISVSVSGECRGSGYGTVLIDLGVNRAFEESSAERLHAFVKPENQASRGAFERAGFANLGEENVKGHRAIHYVRARVHGQA